MKNLKPGIYWHRDDEGKPLTLDMAYILNDDAVLDDETKQRLEKYYIHEDNLLWYWEYKSATDWHKVGFRTTSAEYPVLGEVDRFKPLYGLGFRIQREMKK